MVNDDKDAPNIMSTGTTIFVKTSMVIIVPLKRQDYFRWQKCECQRSAHYKLFKRSICYPLYTQRALPGSAVAATQSVIPLLCDLRRTMLQSKQLLGTEPAIPHGV